MTKYQAIESALNILGSAGYDMETEPYRALAIEFGKLVQKRNEPNPAYDMLQAKKRNSLGTLEKERVYHTEPVDNGYPLSRSVHVKLGKEHIVPMNSMYPTHSK